MDRQVFQAVAVVGMLVAGGAQAQGTVGTIPVQEEPAPAEAGGAGLPYSFVAGRFLHTEYDDSDTGQNGLGIEGSFLLTPNVYLVGALVGSQTDEITFFSGQDRLQTRQLELGAGYRQPLSSSADAIASARVVQQEIELGSARDDDTGYQVAAGLRARVAPRAEVRGEISHLDVFDLAETTLNVSGLYDFTGRFSGGLDAILGDDSKSYGLTVRYGF